jgi:hypothetical protein
MDGPAAVGRSFGLFRRVAIGPNRLFGKALLLCSLCGIERLGLAVTVAIHLERGVRVELIQCQA